MSQPLSPDASRLEVRPAADRRTEAAALPASGASWVGFFFLMVAGALVFWVFDALPFQDLPAHAGLIALRHRAGSSPFEHRFFVVAPHIGPYSLFRFLGRIFYAPLGAVGAVRALETLPWIATPLALVWARRRLHGDRSLTAAYFGLALGFGFMTILGFASYLLGVAALLAALTIWLELMVATDRGDATATRWEIAAACVAPGVFLAHGHAFVIFVALAGVVALATGHRKARIIRLRCLAPALALAAWVAWRERASVIPPGSVAVRHADFAPHFQGVLDKLSLLITPTLITRTGVDAVVGVFVWTVIIAAVVATARSLRDPPDRRTSDLEGAEAEQASRAHSRALLACMGVLAAAFFVLPHAIGWF
ncbi:MAG: hypothetical protein ACREJ3_18890, partial [Polyangiaceae bacterium]